MLGPVGFDAPDSFRGSLDITYLDEDVRLTRGDKRVTSLCSLGCRIRI